MYNFHGSQGGGMVLRYAVFLDEYRRRRGWTIKVMAEKVGVSMDRMEALLSGQHEPKAGDAVRMERKLDIMWFPEDFERQDLAETRKP